VAPTTLIKNARAPACLLFDNVIDPPIRGDVSGVDGKDFVLINILLNEQGNISGFSGPKNPLTLLTDGREPDLIIDADQGILFPGFVESHTHLDKGHIWPRRPNPDGTFMGALDNVGADREAHWSAQDVKQRMEFSLRCAYAHGTTAIRTHIDSVGSSIAKSWPVFAALREKWRTRIVLQAVPLFGIDHALDATHMAATVAAVKQYGSGLLGAVTYMSPNLDAGLDIIFRTAMDNSWDLDFHVDESNDPAARSLERIAQTAIRLGFKGKILCGHCCSLALQDDEDEKRIIELVKQAGISIVSLPLCNMYLQDRQPDRTPRWRGVTSLHELRTAGVPVMISSDNTRDPFYAYGDLDAMEVFREATRIAHFDHPFGDWPSSITRTPADLMGLAENGRITGGIPADLILFKARNWTELLSRPQSNRIVFRHGRIIDTTLPDYRELDALEGMKP
jgi:cytosine/creatinine deaminase